jgi:hypothetical protein
MGMQTDRLWLLIVVAELVALAIYGNIFRGHFAHASFNLPSDLNCFRANGAIALGRTPALVIGASQPCAFMYPPSFLLLAAPLAWLSPSLAYLLWSAGGIAVLIFAAQAAKLSWPAIGMGLISPPSLYCLAVGQTGEIISCLLLLSVSLAATSPVLAGIAAGCLVIKPQFAILLPVCFLASRNWRALSAALITTAAICLLSAEVFGLAFWQHFFMVETLTAHTVLNEPWPQPYQGIMISIFMMVRSLNCNLRFAYVLQTFATLVVIVTSWYLWRPQARVERQMRLLLTLCLVPIATPYAYLYDIPGIALALASYAVLRKGWTLLPLSLFWAVSALYILISMVSFLTGGILLVLLVVYLWSKKEEIGLPSLSAINP